MTEPIFRKSTQGQRLVAHRGYPAMMPGNTMIGFEAALQAGAKYVELDVQLTADSVPVLYHDADTLRMSGVAGSLLQRPSEELNSLRASHPARFGERYKDNPIATLAEIYDLMITWTAATFFIEVKRASLRHFGREVVIDAIIDVVGLLLDRAIIISFDDLAIEYARSAHGAAIGWVLPAWDHNNETRAKILSPEYLFCDKEDLPKDDLNIWRGPWQWAVYVVNDPATALGLFQRGIDLVETDCIVDMLRDPVMNERTSHG